MKLIDTIEEINSVSDDQNIVLYGCGYVGRLMQRYFCIKGVNIKCFIVTESKADQLVNDIPVYSIHDYNFDQNDIIIISTKEILHDEIFKVLSDAEVDNIYGISDSLSEMIATESNHWVRDSLSFQVHITEQCNLNCRGCYHFSPLAEDEYLDLNEYERDISVLSKLFEGKLDTVTLLGGEPLLHPSISEFMLITRKYFPIGTIKILSNGILMSSMNGEFWSAVLKSNTEIWLTKYPISIDYGRIEAIAVNHGVKINYFNIEPVRSLGHQPLDISGSRDYVKNFNNCYRVNSCALLDHGKMFTCMIPAESKHFNRYFHMSLDICEKDYTDIYNVSTGEELLKKMVEPTPFCRYCNRDDIAVFGRIPWSISKRDIKEWTD